MRFAVRRRFCVGAPNFGKYRRSGGREGKGFGPDGELLDLLAQNWADTKRSFGIYPRRRYRYYQRTVCRSFDTDFRASI